MRVLIIAVLTFLLAGCATQPPVNIGDPASVKRSRDDFRKVTQFVGPNLGANADIVLLRSFRFDAGNQIYQIYVSNYYGGDWRFYESAYDSNGNRLDMTKIDRKVESCSRYGCSHTETVALNVDRSYLEGASAGGVRFKVSGRAGEEIFFVPPAAIRAFLDAAR